MQKFKLRRARITDAEKIVFLLGELGYSNTVALIKSKIIKLAKSEKDTVIVVEADDKVVGVAHLHIAELLHQPGRLGRVMTLVVAKKFRRQGIGQRLMRVCEKLARTAGCVKMEVTSGAQRLDAHKFYEGLGFCLTPKRFVKELSVRYLEKRR